MGIPDEVPRSSETSLLTDGAKFIAEECDAYWLVDLSPATSRPTRMKASPSSTSRVKDGKATAQIEDGNGKVLKKQKIEYTQASRSTPSSCTASRKTTTSSSSSFGILT